MWFLQFLLFSLALCGAVVAQSNSTTSLEDMLSEINQLVWSEYQDKLPSCKESTFVSKALADAKYACYSAKEALILNEATEAICIKECSDVILFDGIECERENVELQAALAKKWENLLKTNNSLPGGIDGQILETISAAVITPPLNVTFWAVPGSTASGGKSISDATTIELAKGIYDNFASEPMEKAEYIETCLMNASANGAPSAPMQSSGAVPLPVIASLLILCVSILWIGIH